MELQKLSGNPVVDEVMSYYVVQAREKQIDLTCSMKIRENLALNLADMTVLLGNAMENALYGCETCEENARKIRVMIRQFRKNLLIKIENRIPSGEYESLGANVRKGYGLESIDMIARKYQGSMDAVREEDKFVLRVILNIFRGGRNVKLKDGLILREVAGQYVIVPTGKRVREVTSIVYISSSAAYLWDSMKDHEFEKEDLVQRILEHYEGVTKEKAAEDIDKFLKNAGG